MELEDKIKAFIAVSDGHGTGYGNGYGNGTGDGTGTGHGTGTGTGYGNGTGHGTGTGTGTGYGNGNGHGHGAGTGNGYGNGTGNGHGAGTGTGVQSINGMQVYKVDKVSTIITSVHSNYAKGYTLQHNVNLIPCYIAKCGDFFAHGETLKQAQADAQAKYEQNKPLEERIADFIKQYPSIDNTGDNADLFKWHNVLTGSCEFGRIEFCKNRGVDYTKGNTTIREFINLCKDAYGSDVISQLLKAYGSKLYQLKRSKQRRNGKENFNTS